MQHQPQFRKASPRTVTISNKCMTLESCSPELKEKAHWNSEYEPLAWCIYLNSPNCKMEHTSHCITLSQGYTNRICISALTYRPLSSPRIDSTVKISNLTMLADRQSVFIQYLNGLPCGFFKCGFFLSGTTSFGVVVNSRGRYLKVACFYSKIPLTSVLWPLI